MQARGTGRGRLTARSLKAVPSGKSERKVGIVGNDVKQLSCDGCVHLEISEDTGKWKWPRRMCKLGNPIAAIRCDEYESKAGHPCRIVTDPEENQRPPAHIDELLSKGEWQESSRLIDHPRLGWCHQVESPYGTIYVQPGLKMASAEPPKLSTRQLRRHEPTENSIIKQILDFNERLELAYAPQQLIDDLKPKRIPGELINLLWQNGRLT